MANLFRAYPKLTVAKVGYTQTDKTATLDVPVTLTLAGEGKNLGHLTLSEPITLTLTGTAEAPAKAQLNTPVTLTLTSTVEVMRIGTLNKQVVLTSSAKARRDISGTLNSPIVLISTSVVRLTVYGQASNTLNFLNNVVLTAKGKVGPTKGLLDKTLGLTLTAAAYTQNAKLNTPVTLTLTSATAQKAALRVAISSPLPIVLAQAALPISTIIGNLTPSLPIVRSILNVGHTITGNVTIPISSVSGTAGTIGAVKLKLPIINGTNLTGVAGKSALISKRPQVTGIVSQAILYGGNVSIPLAIIDGILATGAVNVGSVRPRLAVVDIIGLAGSISSGDVTLSARKVTGIILSEARLTGGITISLPTVRGNASSSIASFLTWVLNTKTSRTSNYTNFPFIALGELAGNPMGATTDGIYLLTGDDDDGQAIESTFQFGMADFRNELVGVTDAYVGGSIEGEIELGILEDGQDTTNTYTVAERERHVRGHHTKLGKGFRARYRQLSISNTNGGDFKLSSLTLPSRDLKGNE